NIRNQKVILDADLAELYSVPTKVFNQAVKRKADRFPQDFMFQLTALELENLRSQFAASNFESPQKRGCCAELVTICDQFQTGSGSGLPANGLHRRQGMNRD